MSDTRVMARPYIIGGARTKVVVPPYVGPGDIALAFFWGGLRAYSGAYAATGGPAIDIVDSSNLSHGVGTINVLPNGSLDMGALNSFITNFGTASVTTLYNQSPIVGGADHHLHQATVAKMPVITLNALHGFPAMTWSHAAQTSMFSNSQAFPDQQPYTYSMVARPTGAATGTFQFINGGVDFTAGLDRDATSDANTFACGGFNFTVTANQWNSVQAKIDLTSVLTNVNGSGSAGPGDNNAFTNPDIMYLGTDNTNDYNGDIVEAGVFNADLSSQFSTINVNQYKYWNAGVQFP